MMNTHRKMKVTLFVLILIMLASACSTAQGLSTSSDDGGWINWDGDTGWTGEAFPDMGVEERGVVSEGEALVPLEKSVVIERLESAPPAGGEDSSIPNYQQDPLRAGSVDDNKNWDDYLLYRMKFSEWGIRTRWIDVTERHIIQVSNGQGLPVLGANVTISNDQDQEISELMTHADGHALFFPMAQGSEADSFRVEVEKNGQATTFTIDRGTREHHVILETDRVSEPIRLDVHFLIDATGSMSDEIDQLKENMITISERIHALSGNLNVRFGMTIYRDRNDAFVSRTFDFTSDIDRFTQELSEVVAQGGGDYPESLNEGLHDAIHLPEWRVDETVSLIFLIADAPPQLDFANDYDYAEEVFEATQRGIKVFPIASSGLDDQGEYIFRQLAQITSGKFLFLTYGADGKPGDSTTHHVDDYSVLSLDQLVIRLVEEELASLNGQNIYLNPG